MSESQKEFAALKVEYEKLENAVEELEKEHEELKKEYEMLQAKKNLINEHNQNAAIKALSASLPIAKLSEREQTTIEDLIFELKLDRVYED